ncbi:MAG: excisionase family DNA-binding protein [Pirellulaceae bacterium]|nr:excisionase family DNA-binding protein [Pirellulaceae bacterium]
MKPINIPGDKRFMSVREVALTLSVSQSTIRRFVKRCQIPYLRVGRLRRYHFAKIVEKSFRVDSHLDGEAREDNKPGQQFN